MPISMLTSPELLQKKTLNDGGASKMPTGSGILNQVARLDLLSQDFNLINAMR